VWQYAVDLCKGVGKGLAKVDMWRGSKQHNFVDVLWMAPFICIREAVCAVKLDSLICNSIVIYDLNFSLVAFLRL